MLIILFLVLISHAFTSAQEAARGYFTAELGSPLIGEPIDLLLTFEVPDGAVVTMPELPADWPPFTIRKMGEVEVSNSGGKTSYRQHLTVSLWRPGEYQTPETSVEYQLPNSPDRQQIIVEPAFFVVKTVLNPDDLNLRPLKPPVAVFYISPLAVTVLLVGLAVIAYFAWSNRRKIAFVNLSDSQAGGLHVSARMALDEFKRLDSANLAPPKVIALVSDTLRHYVQVRFGLRAEDMTTAELVENLLDRWDLSEKRQHELTNLLEQADLVKFARMQPPSKSAEKLLNVAQRWVVAVEQETVEAVE
jgi:hypothetical protein